MRSVRVLIVAVTLLLVLLPFVFLGIAFIYEKSLISEDEVRLARVLDQALDSKDWNALGTKEHAWLRRLAADGTVLTDSGTSRTALSSSAIGGFFERLFTSLGAAIPSETLIDIEAQQGRPAGTSNSPSGQTVVVALTKHLPDGSSLYATTANHRGVRQLLLARNQLLKLVLYQSAFALLVAVLLGRWLVRPLESLAAGARRFPQAPLADEALLRRRDELGQVARAFNEMAQNLEARREGTVRLAADIAHELKNPLATIAAASELFAFTANPTAQKREATHATIAEAVRRLAVTTEALLAEVKLESALAGAKRDSVDYAAWLGALLDGYRSDPQHAGWTFALEASPAIGTVSIDADAWARLVRNLLDNARVQPSTSRALRITVARSPDGVTTDVTDFGPGVSEGNREKIFQRFFTLRPEGAAGGTGLGLSIVDAVARAHGGKVELLPGESGKGATFRVLLP